MDNGPAGRIHVPQCRRGRPAGVGVHVLVDPDGGRSRPDGGFVRLPSRPPTSLVRLQSADSSGQRVLGCLFVSPCQSACTADPHLLATIMTRVVQSSTQHLSMLCSCSLGIRWSLSLTLRCRCDTQHATSRMCPV